MKREQLTIVVSGMIAAVPYQGGATWAILQYVLGLRRLGHAVYLIEPIPREAVRPQEVLLESSANARYFCQVVADYQLDQHAALLIEGTQETVGLPYCALCDIAQRTDVLVNISGMLTDPALVEPIPVRVYLDLDPAFNQLWHATQGINMRLDGHTHFATVGLSLGQPECSVPTCGKDWIPTLPPIVLEHWNVGEQVVYDAWTTVANWRGYGSIEHEGVFYGQKAHSLRRFIELPTLSDEKFLLALAIHPDEKKDLAALEHNGWQLIDPAKVTSSPADYREFIQGSKGEFGIAKSGYVAARCGWFSDRSVCYLASGRPVIAQDTGFSHWLPTGEGLYAFKTIEDILASIEAIDRNYTREARAARARAREYFDSDKVLAHLLQCVGANL